MKSGTKYLLIFFLVAAFAGWLYLSYVFLQKNKISHANSLKSKARKEYYTHKYIGATLTYRELIDSLGITDDAVSINYANAAFLASSAVNTKNNILSDSSKQQLAESSNMEYSKLSSSENAHIASIASNQLGYSAIQSGDIFAEDKADSVLSEALHHFKNALIRDPSNDSARYNYELVKKIVLFPENVMNQTRALVMRKRYQEAAALLENAMKRDKRLTKQKDFLTRIQKIIEIDTKSKKI